MNPRNYQGSLHSSNRKNYRRRLFQLYKCWKTLYLSLGTNYRNRLFPSDDMSSKGCLYYFLRKK